MRNVIRLFVIMMISFIPVAVAASSYDQSRDDIFFEDFETDDGGLIGTLDWEWGDYAWIGSNCYGDNYPPPSAYSGTKMWGTVMNNCYSDLANNSGYDTCINGNSADDSILSFDLDLTGYSNVTFSFREWFDLFLQWDWAEVYVNGNVVFQHCGGSFVIPTEWVEQTIDLTPYAGGLITVEFHMMTSSVVNHAGWYIDDVRVFEPGTTPTATPVATMTPTPEPSVTPTPTVTPTVCLHTGDANLDGEITAGDAQTAFLITLGLITPTFEEACAADCNGDDEITAGDAQNIFLVVLGSAICVDPLLV